MSHLHVDLDLVRKYNVAGPRYTSYPPATQFSDQITWAQLAEELIANNKEARDLSLYFHLPFCKTLCWYCGCNTVITKDQSQSAVYLKYLEAEVKIVSSLLGSERRVTQIHLGGGTPTFLLPSELEALGNMIASRFTIASEVEAAVEVDPRRLTLSHVRALRHAGMNRASIGV